MSHYHDFTEDALFALICALSIFVVDLKCFMCSYKVFFFFFKRWRFFLKRIYDCVVLLLCCILESSVAVFTITAVI